MIYLPGNFLVYLQLTVVLLLASTHLTAGGAKTQKPLTLPSHPFLQASSTGTILGMANLDKLPNGAFIAKGYVSGQGHIGANHVVFEGTVSPGNSPGCITMGGNATFSVTAVLVMEIGGPTPCGEHDQLSVANTLTINGATLQLVLINGFNPQPGQRFDLLEWGAFAGGFGNIDTVAAMLPAYLAWDVSQLEVTGEVVVDLLADGDINDDGLVNVVDVLLAQRALLGKITLSQTQFIRGDVAPRINGQPAPDGDFTLGDVLLIQQMALGS